MKNWTEKERRLCELAQAGDVAAIKGLLDEGPAPRARALSTALFYCAQNGHREVLGLLLERGANPNTLAGAGPKAAALEGAVRSGRADLVSLLLHAGAEPNLQSWSRSSSALMQAAVDGKLELVKVLLSAGASPTRLHAGKETVQAAARGRAATSELAGRVLTAVEGVPPGGAQLKKRVNQTLAEHARASAAITFAKSDVPSADAAGSHLGGAPLLPPGAQWPRCEACGAAMFFRVRLRLGDFPFLQRSGVMHLFDCIHYGSTVKAPPAVVVTFREGDEGCEPRSDAVTPRRPLSKIGKVANELPSPLLAGVPSLTDPFERALSLDLAKDEDKVGGWPWTPEALELPRCATCKEPMQLVLQLVSGDNVNFVAGSSTGRLYVSQCAQHREQVAAQLSCAEW